MTAAPPGAQAERTALSWQRTGLAAVAVGALTARTVAPVAGLVLLAAGVLAAAVVAPLRYTRIRRATASGVSPAAPLTLRATALLTLAVLVATGAGLLPA